MEAVEKSRVHNKHPKCKNGCGKTTVKEGLCYRCWMKSHPGEHPYKKHNGKKVVEVFKKQEVEPSLVVTQTKQERIYQLLETGVLCDAITMVEWFISKRRITLRPEIKADIVAILYDAAISEGGK